MTIKIGESMTHRTGIDVINEIGFFRLVREDFARHRGDIWMPGFHALLNYRIGVWAKSLPLPFRLFLGLLYFFGFRFCRAVYGIELQRSAHIGRRFFIAHQHGIIIHSFAVFGDDCIVRQGVTLGASNEWIEGVGPVIGDNVSFAPGSVVLGNINIGDNVQIGANCVVTSDIPSNRILFVPQPRVLPRS